MVSPATLPDRPLRPPSVLARLGEARVGLQPLRLAARAPWLARRTTQPRDVILLPGFGTTDTAMLPLRRYLGVSWGSRRVAMVLLSWVFWGCCWVFLML